MGFGFVNLPSWHEFLRTFLQENGRTEVLRFPVLNAEGFEPTWRSLEDPDFFQAVDTGFHFPDKPLSPDRLPYLITSDEREAERRLFHPTLKVGVRGAIGGTHPLLDLTRPGSMYPPVTRLLACTDGVCSFIFSRMESEVSSFEECLREAQWRGLAPGNPMGHVHGLVFRGRLALLASLIFHRKILSEHIALEEINQVTREDMTRAEEHGFTIRVLGVVEKTSAGFSGWVGPCLIPSRYFLAQIRGGSEAGYVQFENHTALTFSGPGSDPATTVRGMLLDYHSALKGNREEISPTEEPVIIPADQHRSEFFLRIFILDIAGSLSRICALFETAGAAIKHLNHRRLRKKERSKFGEGAEIVLFTHTTTVGSIRAVVESIRREVKTAAVKTCLRCENNRP